MMGSGDPSSLRETVQQLGLARMCSLGALRDFRKCEKPRVSLGFLFVREEDLNPLARRLWA